MNTPLPRRLFVLAASAAFTAATLAGCGGGPQHDPAAGYTPEAIAQELVFRFQSLPAEGKKVSPKAKTAKAAAPLKGDELKKSGETTKQETPETADALLDDLQSKVRNVPGSSPAEVWKKVAAAVRNDRSLSPEDRDALATRLDGMAK